MIESLVKLLLNTLLGTTVEQWKLTIENVKRFAKEFAELSGAEKRKAVADIVRDAFPELRDYVINVLIEVAVAFMRRK